MPNSQLEAFYGRLFKGLSPAELVWLFSDRINSCLRIYSLEDQSVIDADSSCIPWPVLFLLGYRNKKHRYVSRASPPLQHIFEAVDVTLDKLKWRHHFAEKETIRKPFPSQFRYRRKPRPFTLECKSAELNSFCGNLKSELAAAASRSILSWKSKASKFSNVLFLEKSAHCWLRSSEFAAIPSDKLGGFVLVRTSELIRAQHKLLEGPWYQPSYSLTESSWRNSFRPLYIQLWKQICEVDDRISMSVLVASLDGGLERMSSWLMHTCKDHKDPGEMKFRPIHSSTGHSFQGVMAWMNLIMDDVLKKFSHIIRSCDDLLTSLRTFHPVPDMVIVHFDLKDFFMQGSPAFLCHHASLMVPKRFRVAFRAATKFLLENQFVGSRLLPGSFWKVVSGTGMGLKMSSSLADLAFLHAVELCGPGITLSRIQRASGILLYKRFRDNLLFFFEPNFVQIRSIVTKLENASPYTGKIEEASPSAVTFLDCVIYVDHKHGLMRWAPFLKPIALKSVLSFFSAHPTKVHIAWLRAYFLRLRQRSYSVDWYRTFEAEVLRRLAVAGVDRSFLTSLERSCRATYPAALPASPVKFCAGLTEVRVRRREEKFWCVLPFHPAWHDLLNSAIRRFSDAHKCHDIPGVPRNFGIAWSLRSSSLASCTTRL